MPSLFRFLKTCGLAATQTKEILIDTREKREELRKWFSRGCHSFLHIFSRYFEYYADSLD